MTQDALIGPTANEILATAGRRQRRTPRPEHPLAHLASKHPDGVKATWCRTCRQPVLAGLDDLVCAWPAKVDITPLSALGEALARLAGLATYEVRAGKPARIVRRDAHRIAAMPAGAARSGTLARFDVVAAHEHGPDPAEPLRAISALPPPLAVQHRAEPADPPF